MPISPERPNGLAVSHIPTKLRHELRWIAMLGCGLLVAAAMTFYIVQALAIVLLWLLMSAACWAFVLWQCYKRLHLNYSTINESNYSSLGHGNRITLLRGLLIAATAGFLTNRNVEAQPWLPYIPAALYSIAAMGDWLDGYMARRQQQATRLGKELDTVLDAFGLVIAPLLAVFYGKLHVSYLLVSIAYYLFQCGIQWRQSHGKPVFALPPSQMRRYLAGTQMALVAIALWPPFPGDLTRMTGFVLMIPLLIGFCRDWLHVSGRLGLGREPSL